MRLWTLHPRYLDTKGLLAVWREALLAKHVLMGKTKGYVNHPQLIRFRNSSDPLGYINMYLSFIYEESLNRGYKFDASKFRKKKNLQKELIPVTTGQVKYELKHLKRKLKDRDDNMYILLKDLKGINLNPIFTEIDGPVETWEKVY